MKTIKSILVLAGAAAGKPDPAYKLSYEVRTMYIGVPRINIPVKKSFCIVSMLTLGI
jgi:hypothetical protein